MGCLFLLMMTRLAEQRRTFLDHFRLPFFTVILVVYNQAEFLPETLNTLLQQTFTAFTVLILDDDSTDNSFNIAKDFITGRRKDGDQRFSLVHKPNTGLADTRNFGLRTVNTSWVFLLDADDLLHPRLFEESVRKACVFGTSTNLIIADLQSFGSLEYVWSIPSLTARGLLFENKFHVRYLKCAC
jgi:glycosyltransferase involved in cell wall biosynthesis